MSVISRSTWEGKDRLDESSRVGSRLQFVIHRNFSASVGTGLSTDGSAGYGYEPQQLIFGGWDSGTVLARVSALGTA